MCLNAESTAELLHFERKRLLIGELIESGALESYVPSTIVG